MDICLKVKNTGMHFSFCSKKAQNTLLNLLKKSLDQLTAKSSNLFVFSNITFTKDYISLNDVNDVKIRFFSVFFLMFSQSFGCSKTKRPKAQLRGSVGFKSGTLLFKGDTLSHYVTLNIRSVLFI